MEEQRCDTTTSCCTDRFWTREREPLSPDRPTAVQPERIPTFIDELDCLLAVWVAEATLDGEIAPGDDHGPRG